MNKILKYACMAATAFMVAACTEDYTDWADPISYGPEDAITVPGVTAQSVAETIDLAAADGTVQLFNVPTDALAPDMKLANVEVVLTPVEATKDSEAKTIVTDNGAVTVEELTELIVNAWGRAPKERTFNGNVTLNVMQNGSAMRVNAGSIQVKAVPVAPYISQRYWIVGAPSQWDVMCEELPFSHSSADVYDDPVFTVTFPVIAGETWFAIADEQTHESGDWSALLGCTEGNGNNGMEGSIKRRTELGNDGSWKIVADQDYTVRMTINMMDYTYKIEFLLFQPYVYLPGDANGWSFGTDILKGNDEGLYTGYAVIGGEWGWKVTEYPDWDHGDYGNAGDGKIAKGCGNIMEGSEAKQYFATIDLANMTYDLMEVTSFSIIGSVKGMWDTDVDMTPDLANRCWTVTTDLDAGEFKFRVNHDWGKNLGGTYDSMVANGDNLQLPEAGNYTITLYPSYDGASHCTVVKN